MRSLWASMHIKELALCTPLFKDMKTCQKFFSMHTFGSSLYPWTGRPASMSLCMWPLVDLYLLVCVSPTVAPALTLQVLVIACKYKCPCAGREGPRLESCGIEGAPNASFQHVIRGDHRGRLWRCQSQRAVYNDVLLPLRVWFISYKSHP